MLFDGRGNRKYLTSRERSAFLKACEAAPPDRRAFGLLLAYTGCRISEARAVTADRVDAEAGVIVFETLKRRRGGVFRAVPVPKVVVTALIAQRRHHDHHADRPVRADLRDRLFPWARSTAWRHIKELMEEAGIRGIHACPKGLRHGLAVHAIGRKVPLNLIGKWLGHAKLETTAIYADAVGEEERRLAGRMWNAV